MPIPQQVPISEHTGNGVTTTFAYEFGLLDAADLKITINGADVTTGFTVTGVGNRAGGTVVFAVAPANGAAIVLYRDVALVRTTDYQYAGDLREQVLDDDFDRMMMGLQDMLARINRAITIPAGETFATLPSVALRANKVMAFGPSGEIALLSSFGGGGGTIDIVPADLSVTLSKLESSLQTTLTNAVQRDGDVMTGPLELVGDAVEDLEAVPKQQLDAGLTVSAPPGAVMAFAQNTAPTGWLKANGQLVSRTTYAALFAAIGTTYGAGDGSTTFALPDLRGEFVRGWDDGRGIDSGRSIGTAQGDGFRSHNHIHGLRPEFASANVYATQTVSNGLRIDVTDSSNNISGDTSNTGGSETRPRNIALLYCIKF